MLSSPPSTPRQGKYDAASYDAGMLQQLSNDCSQLKSAGAILMHGLENMVFHINQWQHQHEELQNVLALLPKEDVKASDEQFLCREGAHLPAVEACDVEIDDWASANAQVPEEEYHKGEVMDRVSTLMQTSTRITQGDHHSPASGGMKLKLTNGSQDAHPGPRMSPRARTATPERKGAGAFVEVQEEEVSESMLSAAQAFSLWVDGDLDEVNDGELDDSVEQDSDEFATKNPTASMESNFCMNKQEVSLLKRSWQQLPRGYKLWREMVDTLLITAEKKKFYQLRDIWIQPDTFLQKVMRSHEGLDLRVLVVSATRLEPHRGGGSLHSDGAHRPLRKREQTWRSRRLQSGVGKQSTRAGQRASPTHVGRIAHIAKDDYIYRKFNLMFNRVLLDPHSPKKLAWITIGMLLMLFDLCILPMQAFSLPETLFLDVMQWIGQIFWTLDIGVNFITAVWLGGVLRSDFRRIAKQYVTTWFFFDLALVAPLWIAQVAGNKSGGEKGVSLFRVIRMLRFLRLVRMAKFQHYLQEALAAINSSYLILCVQIAKLMVAMMLISHLNACCWYAVGRSSDKGWTDEYADTTSFYRYLTAVHWAFTQFQGTSEILPGMAGGREMGERLYAVLCVMGALIILATFVSSLTNMMRQLQTLREERSAVSRSVQKYLMDNDIPKTLSIRVKKYIDWKMDAKRKLVDSKTVLRMLPTALQLDLQEQVLGPLVAAHGFFQALWETHSRIFRMICHEVFSSIVPAPGEVVFNVQTECTKMYMVVAGQCIYVPSKREKVKLTEVAPAPVPVTKNSAAPRNTPIAVAKREKSDSVESEKSDISGSITGSTKLADSQPMLARLNRQNAMQFTDEICSAGGWSGETEEEEENPPLESKTCLSEAILWTPWEHCGALLSISDATLITLGAQDFAQKICQSPPAHVSSTIYARRFVAGLNRFGKMYNDIIQLNSLVEVVYDDELHY